MRAQRGEDKERTRLLLLRQVQPACLVLQLGPNPGEDYSGSPTHLLLPKASEPGTQPRCESSQLAITLYNPCVQASIQHILKAGVFLPLAGFDKHGRWVYLIRSQLLQT